jgi:hypothetical protein
MEKKNKVDLINLVNFFRVITVFLARKIIRWIQKTDEIDSKVRSGKSLLRKLTYALADSVKCRRQNQIIGNGWIIVDLTVRTNIINTIKSTWKSKLSD